MFFLAANPAPDEKHYTSLPLKPRDARATKRILFTKIHKDLPTSRIFGMLSLSLSLSLPLSLSLSLSLFLSFFLSFFLRPCSDRRNYALTYTQIPREREREREREDLLSPLLFRFKRRAARLSDLIFPCYASSSRLLLTREQTVHAAFFLRARGLHRRGFPRGAGAGKQQRVRLLYIHTRSLSFNIPLTLSRRRCSKTSYMQRLFALGGAALFIGLEII